MTKGRSSEQRFGAWRRLWAAARPRRQPHSIDGGSLGDYAALCYRDGLTTAGRAFLAVAAHLADGCSPCAADLERLWTFLADEEE
jgi:hypothetical protein